MKTLSAFVIAALLTSTALFGNSSNVELGHSRADVVRLLGEPIGTLELGSKTMLMYPQGDVTLRGDKVTEIDLMSDAEFAAQEELKRLEHEEWRIQQEKLLVARKKEGEQIKAAKLQSSAFAVLPAKQQVDYWRLFQVRYPEVDVTEQITRTLEIYRAELAEQTTERRIAALEARISQTEEALEAALDENEQLKDRLDNRNYFLNSQYMYGTPLYPNYHNRSRLIIRSGGKGPARHTESCRDTVRHTKQDLVKK